VSIRHRPSRLLQDVATELLHGPKSRAIPPDDIDVPLVELGSARPLVGQTEVVDYDLRSLGPAEFEALCKAIAMNVLGSDVKNLDPNRPRMWESEFEGSFGFPGSSTGTRWNGFGVLIVKFTSRELSSSQAASWYRQAIRLDLEKIADGPRYRNGSDSYRHPEYILFATNIYLTSRGLDLIYGLLNEYAERLNLRGWHLWTGHDISRYLDTMADVRYGFVLGHDYVSHVSAGSRAANFARFELTDLGEPPVGTPEIIGAWWRLTATHETVTGLFRTLYMVRQRTLTGSPQAQEPLSDGVQDLLRAAIVFTSAGIDACLESLLAHAVPPLIAHNDNALRKFELYLENQVNSPKSSSAFVDALKAPDPRTRLIELYILGLSGSSFQGSSIKERALAALGVTNAQLPTARVRSLDPFFRARNDVVHKLDLLEPDRPDARPASQPRGQDDVGRMCDEALLLMRDVISAAALNLAACYSD
jgi:hypothetical protein